MNIKTTKIMKIIKNNQTLTRYYLHAIHIAYWYLAKNIWNSFLHFLKYNHVFILFIVHATCFIRIKKYNGKINTSETYGRMERACFVLKQFSQFFWQRKVILSRINE